MPDYSQLYQDAGDTFNVDPVLARAVAVVESGENANATSPAGAQGLMGVMPENLRRLNVRNGYVPQFNIQAGTRVLDEALNASNGNVPLALRIYEGGPDQSKWGPVNAAYPAKVAAAYQRIKAKQSSSEPSAASDPLDDFLAGKSPAPQIAAEPPKSGANDALDDFLSGKNKTPTPFSAPSPAAPTAVDEYGRPFEAISPPAAISNIASGIGQGSSAGFQSGMFPEQPGLREAELQTVQSGSPLARVGAAAGLVGSGVNRLLGGLAGGIAGGITATGDALPAKVLGVPVGGPQLARDVLAVPEAFGGSPEQFRVPEDTPPPSIPFVPKAPRTAAEGNLLADFPRASEALAAPNPLNDRMAATPVPVPSNSADAGVIRSEPTAPKSVGAAATDNPPPDTPAQKATALQKMVNQSAEDRLTPGGRDDNVYVPGVERPEAMRDFSPAPEGQPSTALKHKVLYNTDSNYHDQFDALVKKNNNVMVDDLHDMFGDANSREAAMEEARALMPGSVDLFKDEKPVDAQPIVDKIKEILASKDGKRGAVSSQLNSILPKLNDADGNLETLPSMIKGIRDDITDRLYDKTPSNEGNAARTARNQLKSVLSVVDDTIASGLPEGKYQAYLDNLSAALGQVDKQDYLQQYLSGPKKLTNSSGDLQFEKVNKMLQDIAAKQGAETGGARYLSWPEITRIEAVRNELAAKKLLDDRAGVRGSPTVQLASGAGFLGSGPLGVAVRGVAELGAHAALLKTTGGLGNAAMALHRVAIKPAKEAAKARKAAEALAATKANLLNTAPNPLRD